VKDKLKATIPVITISSIIKAMAISKPPIIAVLNADPCQEIIDWINGVNKINHPGHDVYQILCKGEN
jgi:hypothetical protein